MGINDSNSIEDSLSEFSSTLNSVYYTESEEIKSMQSMMEKLLHWAAIIESSDDAIISKSPEGYITSWNKGAEDLYGYTADEVIGKSISVLMPKEKEDDFPKIMKRLKEGKKVDHYETKRMAKDGTVIDVSITVSPIKDSKGNIIGASKIARDVTERKEFEKRRNQFLNNASHELKTPVTSLKIFGELFEEKLIERNEEEYLPFIRKINAQTEKISRLIFNLIGLNQLQNGRSKLNKEPFSMSDLIKEVTDNMNTVSDHSVEFSLEGDQQVTGDQTRLEQVIINFLTNAFKYSDSDTTISIKSIAGDETITVSVKDEGTGISKEHQNDIFNKYFRVMNKNNSTYPGMGIGLNYCQEVVKRHNGTIGVKSEPGKGATFHFTIPKGDESSE